MGVVTNIAMRCLGYLQTIQVTDCIDIAVLSYLLYRLLMWARRSNVGQILKGISLIFIMLWATSAFNLHVINYLLSKTLELGLTAVVIVFQPEIRRFLEQIGAKGIPVFNRKVDVNKNESAINELVDAYASMSKSKIGALTVFERNGMLDEYIKSGTALNCEVSSELLKNIFWPKAPLHDGAVIIRNGRIIGGGCVLPLSSNTNISRELGTRHRAGIGVSESSDAVVVICSEETGSISVAMNGMLKRHLAPETLRRLLCNELLPHEDPDDKNGKWSGLLGALNDMSLNPFRGSGEKEKNDEEKAE